MKTMLTSYDLCKKNENEKEPDRDEQRWASGVYCWVWEEFETCYGCPECMYPEGLCPEDD